MSENISEKITVRLKPDQLEKLDTIMLQKDLNSRSQVIRIAIENFLSENLEELSSKKVVVRLPNNTVNKLMECISAGDVLNIPSAVQIGLDRYLTSIEDYYLLKRKQLLDARLEYQKEVANEMSANENLKK
jgi:Arc/MetJ-type ribon-helix-helix transcriptional regulator